MSETEFRGRLVAEMLAAGADGLAFDPIVLAGGASADPHGTPSPERRLERGQPLLVDFGAAWGGYMADITRTFFVGSASAEHRDIYEAVRAANELGRTIAAPPMTLDTLDRRVTDSLRASGFADLVLTKTGHGLGLDVHEAPQVMVGNLQAMEPGMVFTIEPGLYRDGDIGVRIEDDVLVTRGRRRLAHRLRPRAHPDRIGRVGKPGRLNFGVRPLSVPEQSYPSRIKISLAAYAGLAAKPASSPARTSLTCKSRPVEQTTRSLRPELSFLFGSDFAKPRSQLPIQICVVA